MSSSDSVAVAISPKWNRTVTRLAGLAPIFSAKSARDAPRRIVTIVDPSPRGTLTPPSDGASRSSNSARFVRFDLRALDLPPPLPNAPAVPPPGPRPRPPAPGRPPPGAPPGPPPKPGRAPAPAPAPAPPNPGRAPGPPGRAPAPAGRGPPGRPNDPAAPGAPGEPGRGDMGRGMLLGLGRVPMPCDDENGLLPGRGPPAGRVPMPCDDENGLLPGRAAGFAPVSSTAAPVEAGVASVAGAAGTAGASDTPLDASAGAGASTAAVSAGALGAGAAFGAAFAAGAASAGTGFSPSASRAARSLRATGGSIVDETPLTYSPKSFSFASAIFESIPYSCAIS